MPSGNARVGIPYGRQGAHWAILSGGTVEMRRTAHDPVAACTQVTRSSSYPDVAEWTDYRPGLIEGPASPEQA